MTPFRRQLRPLAAASLLCAAGIAHAAITTSTSASQAAFTALVSGSTDTFADLTINSSLGTNTLGRTLGSLGYTVSTQTNLWTVQTQAVGGSALTVDGNLDTFSFAFASPVLAFGGNFYLTELTAGSNAGPSTSNPITVIVTDINNLTKSTTLNSSAYFSAISDSPLLSVVVQRSNSPVDMIFPTADNLVLSAVPEPASWAMALGGAVLLAAARRRRAAAA